MTRITRVPMAAQRVVPWRNGQGSTREIAIEPPDATVAGAFAWRVSSAAVGADGPFSTFAGIDRSLWLLRGRGMVLDLDGREVQLTAPLQRVDFAGEARVHARLLDGPIDDLNVMTDRARVRAACEVIGVADAARELRVPATALLLALAPLTAQIDAIAHPLAIGDALRLDLAPGERTEVHIAGTADARALLAVFAPR